MARDYGKENKEWNSPENRKKRQKEYMEKHGPQKPRRKRLWPPTGKSTKETLRDKLKKVTSKTWGRKGFYESAGGGVKAKPHSTKEGRTAAGKRKIKRIFGAATKPKPLPSPGRPLPSPGPGLPQRPDPSSPWRRKDRVMTPLRAKHGIGSLVKKGISTILKPKGVFKPKPVPKAVTDVDRPFKGYDKSYTRADDKKITSMLKKLGDEIKAQPLPSKLKKTLKKAQKAFPHKKAKGGRIGLKHGGSVGAAKRGHGAEIK